MWRTSMPIQRKAPHRRTLRLPNYDYRQPGLYFITICTQNRKWLLGDIVNNDMCLNKTGTIVQSTWKTLPQRFPHLELDQHIIMPNHIHGIIALVDTSPPPQNRFYTASVPERFRYSTSVMDSTRHHPVLGEIIRTFKAAATYSIHTTGIPDFAWQDRYHEHVIRDDEDLDRIRHYIINNPACWAEDLLSSQTPEIAPSCSGDLMHSPSPPRGTR